MEGVQNEHRISLRITWNLLSLIPHVLWCDGPVPLMFLVMHYPPATIPQQFATGITFFSLYSVLVPFQFSAANRTATCLYRLPAMRLQSLMSLKITRSIEIDKYFSGEKTTTRMLVFAMVRPRFFHKMSVSPTGPSWVTQGFQLCPLIHRQ